MAFSIIAVISLIIGLVLFAQTPTPERRLLTEIGRMMMWCGFLVLILEAAGWHAIALH